MESRDELDDELGFSVRGSLEPTNFSEGTRLLGMLGSGNSPGRARGRGNRGNTGLSAAAVNQKEKRSLQKEVVALTKRAEAAESKNDEFRQKMKAMRGALETREKQLAMAKRSLERLGAERDQLEVAHAQDQAHSRKLESKLNSQMGLNEMSREWKAAKTKVKTMEEAVREAERKLIAAEDVQRAQKKEIDTLRHALDVNVHELSTMGGHDISSRLLYSVAKGREEGVALAVQLTEQRDVANSYKMDLSKAEMEVRKLEEQLRNMQEQKEGAEGRVLHLQAELSNSKAKENATAARLTEVELRYNQLKDDIEGLQDGLQRERSRAEQLVDQVATEQRNSKRAVEAARRDMVTALDDVTSAATRQQDELKQRMKELKEEHKRALMSWVDERTGYQQRAGQAETQARIATAKVAKLEAELSSGRADLHGEISNLHADCDSLTEANHKLQSSNRALTKEAADKEREAEEYRTECRRLEGELASAKQAVDSSTQAKYNQLLQELCNVSDERDHLAGELKKTLAEATSNNSTLELLRREVARLEEMNTSLTHSKAGMQRSMMEEIARVQAQLNELQRENQALRAQVTHLPTVDRVQQYQQAYSELGRDPVRQSNSFLTYRQGNPIAGGRNSKAMDDLLVRERERTPTPRDVGNSAAVAAYAQALSWGEDSPRVSQRSVEGFASPSDSAGNRHHEQNNRIVASGPYVHSSDTHDLNTSGDSLGLQSPGDNTMERGAQSRGNMLTLSQIADIDPSGL